MKKTSLLLGLLAMTVFGKAFAGSLNVFNMTPCDFEFYSGIGTITDPSGATYQFSFGPMNITPGPHCYPDVTQLPNFVSYAPGGSTQGTVCVDLTKVLAPGNVAFAIGKMVPITTFNSNNNPACNNGNNYGMFWNTASNNCDAVVLIF